MELVWTLWQFFEFLVFLKIVKTDGTGFLIRIAPLHPDFLFYGIDLHLRQSLAHLAIPVFEL